MAYENHLDALKTKHAAIEQEIARESLRPHPDELLVTRLKREKLKLKEEISHFYEEDVQRLHS